MSDYKGPLEDDPKFEQVTDEEDVAAARERFRALWESPPESDKDA